MILISVFNSAFDLELPRYDTIYLSEYIFDFILLNICLCISYNYRNSKIPTFLPWFLTLIFCLYAFWDTDYFTFAFGFSRGLPNVRDFIYPYLAYISFDSYIIFRLYIWGIGIILYYYTSKRFNIRRNLAIFIFISFFLLTFSYARASLGMAFYFYGLSFLLIKKGKTIKRMIIMISFFTLAFMAHRSMVFLIALTPLTLFNLRKSHLWLILALIPLFVFIIHYFTEYIALGGIGGNSDLTTSASKYASFSHEQKMNWKYMIVTWLHYMGFYIALIYILYYVYFAKHRVILPTFINRLLPFLITISIISFILITSPAMGLWIIGYRFLYMTGIPLCCIIGYMYQNRLISTQVLNLLMMTPILYSECFILGKIISLM